MINAIFLIFDIIGIILGLSLVTMGRKYNEDCSLLVAGIFLCVLGFGAFPFIM